MNNKKYINYSKLKSINKCNRNEKKGIKIKKENDKKKYNCLNKKEMKIDLIKKEIEFKQTFAEHCGYISFLLLLDNNNIACASWDKSIRIFSINKTNTNIFTSSLLIYIINAHDDDINSLVQYDSSNMILSCSDDKTMKLWIINYIKNTYELLKIFTQHTDGIFQAITLSTYDYNINNDYLLSCSRDSTLRLWTKFPFCENTHTVHLDKYIIYDQKEISSLWITRIIELKKHKWLLSGSNGFVCLWDLITFQLLSICCMKYTGVINSMQLIKDNGKVNVSYVVIGNYAEIDIVEIPIMIVVKRIECSFLNDSFIFCVMPITWESNVVVFCGCEDGWFYKVDVLKEETCEYKSIHSKDVTCMIELKDNKSFLTASADGTIKIWNI